MNRSTRYWVAGFAVLATILTVIFVFYKGSDHDVLASSSSSATVSVLHPTITFSVNGTATNLPAAFASDGIAYYPEDKISAVPSPALGIGSIITVTRALPVTVIDGNTTTVQRTWASTVGGLLTEKNIILGTNDKVSPNLATSLTASTTITITRVAVTNVVVDQPIAYNTVNQNDANLNQGLTQVGQAGQNGTMAYTYLVRRENGVEVSNTLISTAVTVQPQTKIILVGTKPYIHVPCASYGSAVLSAAIANGVDPNLMCNGLITETNGNANDTSSSGYEGLFQYDPSFWASVSVKAGYAGADIFNASAQIKVTAWALAHGYTSRWWWAS